MAMTPESHRHLSRQFEQRLTKKGYVARVHGEVSSSFGSIELPLICDWPNRPKQMVEFTRGKHALTHYKVAQKSAGESFVELTPVTGRSHQLRVHMLSLGHPILGDRLYAEGEALEAAHRLQLHAVWLAFSHPASGKWMRFEQAAPFAFKTSEVGSDN